MTSRAYEWLSNNGGTWSLASDWDDVTDGIDPSLTAPGASDSATVAGPSGASVQTIAGPGAAAIGLFTGNTHLAGTFAFGALTLGAGGAGGLLEAEAGDSLRAGTATLDSGSLLTGGGTVSVSGTLTLGSQSFGSAATLYAEDGGSVRTASLFMGVAGAAITVVSTASVEVGEAGGATAGALTVDAGALLVGQGGANAYGEVVNNGLITAQGGTLSLGALSGTGSLSIAAGATLELNGRTGAGQSISFAGTLATLAIATEFDAPPGTMTGFAAGDAIDMLGSPITGATYSSTGPNIGVLTLTYGGQTADTLTLAGSFIGDVFLPSSDGAGGTDITLAPAVVSTGGPSPGTTTPDDYVWIAPGAGAWNVAANWEDVSAGSGPAVVAPGVNDAVTMTGGADGFLVVAGPGNASSLSVTGALALSGVTNIGTLSVGSTVAAVLDLLPGAVMQALNATVADGGIDVSGAGGSLGIAGTLLLGGGPPGIGLPEASLSASDGASVTLAGLVMGGGSGAFVTTDPISSIVIGTAAGDAGAVTVAQGAVLSGNGTVNPFAPILDNGLIEATGTGETLTLGAVGGTGSLLIQSGATLDVLSPTSNAISFAAQDGSLVPTLDVGSELALPTGLLSGLAPGDVIDVLGDPISSVSLARSTTSPSTLTLYYGSTIIGRLSLAGSFPHEIFVTVPDAANGTDLLLVQQGGGGGGGGGGTGNTDTLAWTAPQSGAWSRAGNWTDLTTGASATSPPGEDNPVIVAGPTGSVFEGLTGPGTCSSLLFTGNTLLNGNFATGSLNIGTVLLGTLSTGTLEILAGDQFSATTADVMDGALLVAGNTTEAGIAGTLTVGGSGGVAAVAVSSNASMQAEGLVLGASPGSPSGAVINVDATGSLEVGTLGGVSAGALTIDTGADVSGAGSLDVQGAIIDNGIIAAAGGTLVVGAFSGVGTLTIGNEADLILATDDPSASACQIVFQGGGATLDLVGDLVANTSLPCIIVGFAPGDAIVSSNTPVSSVSFTQGAGAGTLTLSTGGSLTATMRLAGNYQGDVFAVQPDGTGSEITVTNPSSTGTGPSAGTPTPDLYVWTGADGSNWNDPVNWDDISASQTPALVAPGLNDLVTVDGGSGQNFLLIAGRANAAELTLQGNVALSGVFSAGGIDVGPGLLALGAGSSLAANAATAQGGIDVQGGTFSVGGSLLLAGGNSGGLMADSQAAVTVENLVMAAGSAVLADGTSSVDIGGLDDAAEGTVTVDQGSEASGAGGFDVLGSIVDNGIITAAGGTLTVGAIAGNGTLLIGQGAEMALAGPAGSGVIIDFAANGTLSATVAPAAAIEGFGSSDAILLPLSNATAATYAPSGSGTGVLTITGTGADGEQQTLATLTLLGVNAQSQFSVSGAAGGGTLLTTTTAQNGSSGSGGSTMSGSTTPGGQVWNTDQFIGDQPSFEQQALDDALAGLTSWVFNSPDGSFDGAYPDFGYANIGLASDPAAYGPAVALPYGYKVLIADGNNPINIVDWSIGDALLIGNAGNDSITSTAKNDTMLGAVGANTVFWATENATMVGGGNDTFVGEFGSINVTTSTNGSSAVWLGPADNSIITNGNDTVAYTGQSGIHNDTVRAEGGANTDSLIVGPDTGQMLYYAGAGQSTIVGKDGTMAAYGGTGHNLVVGLGGYLEYVGGAGTALVVGVAGDMYIQGGAGAMTVFGGLGSGEFSAQPGNSYFVVGDGPSTVDASAGNAVWLEGGANVVTSVNGGGVIVWGANSSGNNIFEAGSGPATLVGGYGNDLFEAGSGNATLEGGSGNETFSFSDGMAGGDDVLQNFVLGHDVIALHGYDESAASILSHDTVTGGSTILALNDGTHITLDGVTKLTAASFKIS
jgi:hypothetical protein